MSASRRSFLKSMAAAVAGASALEVDPERLLWMPGAKTFFLPAENRMTVEAATDADVMALADVDLNLAQNLEARVNRFSDRRYSVATPDGVTVLFDEHWRPVYARLNGKEMTAAERVAHAHRLFSRAPAMGRKE